MRQLFTDIRQTDRELTLVFTIAAFSLIGNAYFSDVGHITKFLHGIHLNRWAQQLYNFRLQFDNLRFFDLAFWVSVLSINYLLLPALYIGYSRRLSFKKTGFTLSNLSFRTLKNYALLYLLMLPVIYGVSKNPDFLHKYPFYKPQPGEPLTDYFIFWEILYFIQFIGVEFFFRGFLIHATKHRFGMYSVFVSILPYVMIHFGKPLPETIGAIGAGFILGMLSYKSGSVIPGIFLHYAVAVTMDILAL